MEILIIKLGAIGDVVRTTSVLPGLKIKYPGSRISWLTSKTSKEILKNNQYLSAIIAMEDVLKDENNEILSREYSLIISLDDDEKSCVLASKLKKEKLIGAYMEGEKRAYTPDSAPWFDMGLTSRFGKAKADELKKENQKTYQKIISDILGIKVSRPILNLSPAHLSFAQDFQTRSEIDISRPLVGINTGAGNRWPQKKLSVEKTISIIDSIAGNTDAQFILFGGPDEEERNKNIIEGSKTRLIDAGCHNSLLEFAALISLADIMIVSDSLALHLAVALKRYVIAFFGPTSASEIELYKKGVKITPDLGCLSCYHTICNKDPDCSVLQPEKDIISHTIRYLSAKQKEPKY